MPSFDRRTYLTRWFAREVFIAQVKIQFDILIKNPASVREPTVSNIESFRASEEDIEYCRRWLASEGVVCHPTGFGLAGEVEPETFVRLFGSCADPRPPKDLAEYVEQITLTRSPEFFGDS